MPSFSQPRSLLGVLGIMLSLVALFLVLEYAGGATHLIATLATGGTAIFGTLQGRPVSYGGATIGAPAPASGQ